MESLLIEWALRGEGVRACRARLVLICARESSDPDLIRPFVLAIPDVDFILVTGAGPDPDRIREGDPGSRGYFDPTKDVEDLIHTMQFILRGLGIAAR